MNFFKNNYMRYEILMVKRFDITSLNVLTSEQNDMYVRFLMFATKF